MNKYLKIAATVIFILFSSLCFSQKDTVKRQLGLIPKADIFWPITGIIRKCTTLSFSLEKQVFKHVSVQLSYFNFYGIVNRVTGYPPGVTGYPPGNDNSVWYESDIVSEFRYYFSKSKKTKGFYAGIYSELTLDHNIYQNLYSLNPSNNNIIDFYEDIFSNGILVGYQFYIGQKISFDLTFGLGAGKIFYTSTVNSENWEPLNRYLNESYTWQDGIINVNIGYRL